MLPTRQQLHLTVQEDSSYHSPCVCSFPGLVFGDPILSHLFQYCFAVSVPSPPAYVQPAAEHPPWKGDRRHRGTEMHALQAFRQSYQ